MGWRVLGYHRLCESKLKESDNLEPISFFFPSVLYFTLIKLLLYSTDLHVGECLKAHNFPAEILVSLL